jgi:predicted nucleotidyltransferase component of viral defense system
MISSLEIRQIARIKGVPLSTIERDYAQNWLLSELSTYPLVLKGGTGIKKVYFEDYRFSDDIDFTATKDINKKLLIEWFDEATKNVQKKSGIYFKYENTNINEDTTGFEVNTYFQITQKKTHLTKIKIDITSYDKEKLLLPINIMKIIHPYSDNLQVDIKVYAIEEILAEKIRSFFQRTRPRDLYDVWFLWDKISQLKCLDILQQKFSFSRVKFNIQDLANRKDDFKCAWENSLKHQLTSIPDFECVYRDVLELIIHNIKITNN